MTEILTESFCERCGTRYTFESVAPRQRRLGSFRVLGRGLKNFVMSDDSSLDEAMAAARSDVERDATSLQLDAFHRTFNFCMSCRQYTCRDCWNATEARCLSCAPLPGAGLAAELAPHDHPLGPLLELDAARQRRTGLPMDEPYSRAEPELIGLAEATAHAGLPAVEQDPAPAAEFTPVIEDAPAAEVETDAAPWVITPDFAFASDAEPDGVPEPAFEAEAQAGFEADADVEPAVKVHAEPEAEVEAGEPAEAAGPVEDAVPGLEPGTSLDDVIAAYEASVAEASIAERETPAGPGVDVVEQPTWETRLAVDAATAIEPAPLLEPPGAPKAEEPVAEPAVALEPAAIVAELEPAPTIEIVREPEPEPVATAPVVPPASLPAPEPPSAAPLSAPQWPVGPRWPTAIPARQPVAPPPAVAQPLPAVLARQATEAMWAASSRDVVQPPVAAQAPVAGVQPCVSCGISLSATARFCRRCGTSQLG